MNEPNKTQSDERRLSNGGSGCVARERALGIVQNVDLIGRDMKVLLQKGVGVFDIPPDCPIFLRGEQIKLRMVQPRDQVRITFNRRSERFVAEKLEIQPDSPVSSL